MNESQAGSPSATAAFDDMVARTPGFRPRAGQRDMAQHIVDCLTGVTLGDEPDPVRAIALVQAGTGVGKSAAYLATTVHMALARKTRVLISTATVALQEQLMTKDLPALAAMSEAPFAFALAKGRGRYVCKLKLERLGDAGSEDDLQELLGLDEDTPPSPGAYARQLRGEDPQERRQRLWDTLNQSLATGHWDGDRDALAEQPEARDWSAVAADRHTCTARHCPRYKDCSYYQARNRLAQAQVIVANHDLVLSSLGLRALPELDNCLVVFDEGHHLPAVALDQFSSAMDLSHLRWLDQLPRTLIEVGDRIGQAPAQDVRVLAQQLKVALTDLGRLMLDTLMAGGREPQGIHRFAHGVLPAPLLEPLGLIQDHAAGLSAVLDALGNELKRQAREDPSRAADCARLYARLGPLAPRLGSIAQTAGLMLENGEQPLAKWLKADVSSGLLVLSAHACPIVPGDLLRQHLWTRVRGAVITSATLSSCGSFDYFLAEAGLQHNPAVRPLMVSSPFDYATHGQLLVVETLADPKYPGEYTPELVRELCADLKQVKRGALVLFTSRAQMAAAVDGLDAALRDRVWVQGQLSRARLLAAHQARVEAGHPSVIFGLQSFGEGLDLPGALCETVMIAKLPFSSPTDPVDEARAEWLSRLGRDPFTELVVPAAGIRLLQWTGRAIRTETDQATVICYDRRLLRQAFGRRMLQGLPPYALRRRVRGVVQDA